MRQTNVLIVDDDRSKLAMLCDTVAVYGNCTVTHCSTYEDAVDHLVNHYDIVIIDYYLQNGSFKNSGTGYDILHAYKSLHPKTKVILYSGNRDAIENEEAKRIAIDSMQVQTEIFNFLDSIKDEPQDKPKDKPKEGPKEEPKEEDRTSHNHHRSGDKKNFWQIQNGLLSIFLTIIAFGGTFALIKAWGQSATIPYIEKVSCRLDSLNHIPILKDIDNIRSIEKETDTNIAIIKSILEVIATSDQLIIAEKRRTNPTGIR